MDAETTVATYAFDGLNRRVSKPVSNCGTEPVASAAPLEVKGFSLKRVDSPLQPARPVASASMDASGQSRERAPRRGSQARESSCRLVIHEFGETFVLCPLVADAGRGVLKATVAC